jgi:hypothetical protein
MAKFLFAYRVPRDYTLGRPENVAAWIAWFESVGANLVERGSPVVASSLLGSSGTETRLGGYSLVSADDFETALAMAKGCPALELSGGVEVGVIADLDLGTGSLSVGSRNRAPAAAP